MDDQLVEAITDLTGIQIEYYRQGPVERTVHRRMKTWEIGDEREYAEFLEENEKEVEELLAALSIGVTEFFRFRPFFDAVEDLLQDEFEDRVEIWSAGCSTGEEPYSLAILLEELGIEGRIVATDIYESAIGFGRDGRYTEKQVDSLPDEYLEEYFTVRESGIYEVSDALRDRVEFRRHDIISDEVLGPFDLVSCRNTVKFFQAEIKKTVFVNLYMALAAGGYLGLGIAESVPRDLLGTLFDMTPYEHHIYRKISREA